MRIPPGTYHFVDQNGITHTIESAGNSLQLDPPEGDHIAYNEEWDRYEDGANRLYAMVDGYVLLFSDNPPGVYWGQTEGWGP